MRRVLPLLLILVILILVAMLVYLFASPQIEAIEPADGSEKVHPGSDLRITFSRQMDKQSVLSRLRVSPPTDGEFTWEQNSLVFKPGGGWQNGIEVQIELAAGATADGLLPLAIRQDFQSSFMVSNPRLAYLYPAAGLPSLYTIQPLTGEIELLVDFRSGILDYELGPDQSSIFFSGRNAVGGSDLFAIDLAPDHEDSQDQDLLPYRLVLPCQKDDCRSVMVSPRGDYLAFEKIVSPSDGGTGFPQVWLSKISSDGEVTEDPFRIGDPDHQTLQPSWSSAGILAYYDGSDFAYVFFDPIQNREITRFPNDSGETGSWLPNENVFVAPQFYFLEDDLPGVAPVVNSRLTAYFPDDGSSVDLSKADDLEDLLPSFSPDGENLAFARRFLNITLWTPGKQLWVIPVNEDNSFGQAFQLTNAPFHTHYDFAWSQGSDQLAFVRFDQTTLTEPPEIWVLDPVTFQEKQLIIGGVSPKWIP